jgi:hypothetical protein
MLIQQYDRASLARRQIDGGVAPVTCDDDNATSAIHPIAQVTSPINLTADSEQKTQL